MKSKKGPDSYFSKILLQINNKLGGFNYFLNLVDAIEEKNIILMGIDSSHKWGRMTSKYNNKKICLAMVSTKDKKFSEFFSKSEIINYEKNYDLNISSEIYNFIKQSIEKYSEKNKEAPKNIIIYRQGVQHNHLKIIRNEALKIEEICKKLNLKYYYVVINTRETIKFFELNLDNKGKNSGKMTKFKNPEQGLIISSKVTNKKRFEFYIQPQKVNIGSATPTYFRVPCGNIDNRKLLKLLTYWTSYIYQNWQNAVRIPHVVKMAEKLGSITANFTNSKLNEKLNDKQSFL